MKNIDNKISREQQHKNTYIYLYYQIITATRKTTTDIYNSQKMTRLYQDSVQVQARYSKCNFLAGTANQKPIYSTTNHKKESTNTDLAHKISQKKYLAPLVSQQASHFFYFSVKSFCYLLRYNFWLKLSKCSINLEIRGSCYAIMNMNA